jgi:hypothetical protein
MKLSDFYDDMKGWVSAGETSTVAGSPQVPNAETQVSPYLRTTQPLPLQYSGDTIKQFNLPGLSKFRIAPLPPSGLPTINSAATSATVSAIATAVASIPSSSGGLSSVGLSMPPQYGVANSPLTSNGEIDVTWDTQTPGDVLGVPLATTSVGGSWDTTAEASGVGTSISVTGAPSTSTEAMIFFMGTAGATQPTPIVPSGGGWTAIDATPNGDSSAIYTKNVSSLASFTATAPITSNTWSGLLAFFGTTSSLSVVQTKNIVSGGFSGNNTPSGSFTSSVTVGHMILVFLNSTTQSGINMTVDFSVTDSLGNNFSLLGFAQVGGNGVSPYSLMSVWGALVTTGGPDTIHTILNILPSGRTLGGTVINAYEIAGQGVINTLPRFVPVTSTFGAIDLGASGPGGVTGTLPVSKGGTSADLSATGGTSEVVLQTTSGGAFTVRQLDYTDLAGQVAAPIYFTRNTAAAGLVAEFATENSPGQTGNIALGTFLSGVLAGMYRATVYIIVSQAATTSSTMPDTQIQYVDRDSGATITINATAGSSGNTTSTFATATVILNAANSSTIKYATGQVTPYASVGGTPMQYTYRARLEFLG